MKKEQYILNALPSRGRENDWDGGWLFNRRKKKAKSDKLPESLDLRSKLRVWGRAHNQAQTGACVGHAVGTVLHYHWLQGRIVPNQSLRYLPSFRWLWEGSKETDAWKHSPSTMFEASGTYIKDSLNLARKYGVLLEKDYPMHKLKRLDQHESFYLIQASLRKVRSYFAVRPDEQDSHGIMTYREWLAKQGPIVTRLDLDDAFRSVGPSSYVLEEYDKRSAQGGHAVVIAGYKPGYFLLRNSWSAKWGHRGYCWVSDAYAAAAFSESYGVTV